MHIFTEFRENKLVKYGSVFPSKNVFLYSSLSLCQPEYMIRSLIFHSHCQELSRTFVKFLEFPDLKKNSYIPAFSLTTLYWIPHIPLYIL